MSEAFGCRVTADAAPAVTRPGINVETAHPVERKHVSRMLSFHPMRSFQDLRRPVRHSHPATDGGGWRPPPVAMHHYWQRGEVGDAGR
jgi:hypothetical protein